MIRATAASTSHSAHVQHLNQPRGKAQRPKIASIFQGLCVVVACSLASMPTKAMAQQRDYSWRTEFAESHAQVVPDGTLPTSVEQLLEIMKINGGQRAGNNLFHSFEEFSIPEGISAIFENAMDIENIFTRITGESISNIDGVLKTQSGANFFLVNPNGIVFGENAQLDVGGSFIATTANSIQFEGGTDFAASDSANEPIITIDRPIGLNFNGNNGAIEVNGKSNQIRPSFSSSPTEVADNNIGLSIDSGKTIALIGNNLTFNSSTVNASEGRIELGSVSSGSVNFQPAENGFTFDFNNVTEYKNIDLTNQTVINASGENKGEIYLTAQTANILNGSLFLIQNKGNIPSGNISIDTIDSLTLSGTFNDGNVSSAIFSEALGFGAGANINISTRKITLKDGARISAITNSDAPGGNLNIISTELVQLSDNALVKLLCI